MLVVTKEKLEASLCTDSFFDFVCRFWDQVIPERPIWNWHIEYLCGELQQIVERVIRREPKLHDLVINISPGSTKSTICSVMLPAWCWARDATLRMICGSYASPLALHLSTQSRRIIESDKYSLLFPDVQVEGSGKELISTTRGGQRIATSVGGSISGMHGHLLIIDDPINPKEAVSKVGLKSASEWFDHTLMSRKVDKALTPTILIMQRLHQTDPTGHVLEQWAPETTRHVCLPAELTAGVRPRALRAKYVDGLFDPVRMPRKVLDEAKLQLGEYAYAGQFLQSPIPAGGAMFRSDLLQVVKYPSRPVRVVRYWDKAGTSKGGAWTVGLKMCVDVDKRFGVLDVVRGQWEANERERIIKQTAIADGKTVLIAVEQEPGSGGKESAQATLRNLAGYRVKVDRPLGDKELRADPFAVQVNGGNVWLLRGEWNRVYLDELQFFPFSTYKDQVDASSGAFATLTKGAMRVGAFK